MTLSPCIYRASRRALFFLSLLFLLCCLISPAASQAQEAGGQDAAVSTAPARWSMLAGYGWSHPGLGDTQVSVETLDLIARRETVLIRGSGNSWYQGYHSLLIEAPLHLVVDPDVAPIIGLNFLACWTFTSARLTTPYIFAGGGPLYTNADIPGLGAHFNGNYQAGLGLRYHRQGSSDLLFEYRYHHISNGGTKEPNDPINSSKLLVGFTF